MGTNAYLITKNKAAAEKYAPYSYSLVDTPYFGYEIHMSKTSGGWLPLFQGHTNGIMSVKDYKEAYDTGEFEIWNEYGEKMGWDEYADWVLCWNGGTREKRKIVKCDNGGDPDMPGHIPISHFEYANGRYNDDLFCDSEGYEFCTSDFS